jgi:hypothetical protein
VSRLTRCRLPLSKGSLSNDRHALSANTQMCTYAGTGRTSAPRRSLQSSSREWGLDHSQLGQEQQQQQQQEAKSASHRAAPQRQVTPVKFAGSSPLGGASQQPTFGGSAGRGTMKHSPPQQRPQRLSFDGTGNGNGEQHTFLLFMVYAATTAATAWRCLQGVSSSAPKNSHLLPR